MAVFLFLFTSQFNTTMNKTQCSCQGTLDQLKATTAGSSAWSWSEEQMIRVTPAPGDGCKEGKEAQRQLCGSVLIPRVLSLPFLPSYSELFGATHTLLATIKYRHQA